MHRAQRPDQTALTLKLKPGKNQLLLKMCNGDGDVGVLLRSRRSRRRRRRPWFEDVSAAWGLGPDGMAADVKGDTLAVADVNGDGKPDFLYGAGTGMLVLNTGGKLRRCKADSGIALQAGQGRPGVRRLRRRRPPRPVRAADGRRASCSATTATASSPT